MNGVWGRDRGGNISRGVGSEVWCMSFIGGRNSGLNRSKRSINSWERKELVVVVEVETDLVGVVERITINPVCNCVWDKNIMLN